MSNLKKVVSLVLVVVMVFAMGASSIAAFSDASDINFKDEVNLLSALGILSGYPDGSFKPTGTVTRAEYAKMLFMVKLGHLDASGFVNATTTFQDLEAAAWAKGYIKYLYNVGVVAGKNAAQFDPNGQVTGYEAVKMLLVALGYKAENAGLVGERWKVNTLSLGQERGLLDGYNIDFDAPCTRELASLLITNGLDAVCVKYSGLSLDSSGNLTTDVIDETRVENGNTYPLTLGYKAFGLYHETGIIVATENLTTEFDEVWDDNNTPNDKTDDILIGYEPSGKTDEDYFILKATAGTAVDKDDEIEIYFDGFDESLFGQKVVVAYKKATNGDYVAYGVTATGESKVYASRIVDTKYADSKLTTKVDGSTKEFKTFDDVMVNTIIFDEDGEAINTGTDVRELFAGSTYDPDPDMPVLGKNLRLPGTLYVIDTDNNGKPDYYYVLGSAFGRVDTYNTSDEEFSLYGTGITVEYEDDDFDKVSGNFSVGDYAFANLKIDGGINVVPADKLTVKVTKTNDDNVYVGDTEYYGFTTVVKTSDFNFNSTYTIYTDGTFIGRRSIDSTETASVDNVAIATYISTDLKSVRLLRANGDEDVYTYTNSNTDAVIILLNGTVSTTIGTKEAALVKTSFDSSGRVKLSQITEDDSAAIGGASSSYSYANKTVSYGGSTYYLDDSSRVFVARKGLSDYDVFSKSGLKTFNELNNTTFEAYGSTAYSALVYRTTSSGYKYVVAAYIMIGDTDTMPTGTKDEKFVFLTSSVDSWKNSNGTYFSITGYSDGSKVTYTSEDAVTLNSDIKKYSWVKAALNDDGEIETMTLVGGINYGNGGTDLFVPSFGDMIIGAIKAYDSSYKTVTLYADNADEDNGNELLILEVDSDTEYYMMSASGVMTKASISDLTAADFARTSYYTNCFYLADGSYAEKIIIMATNRCSSIDSAFQW